MPIKYLILHGSRSYDECSVYGHDDNLGALLKQKYKTTIAFFGQNDHRLRLRAHSSVVLNFLGNLNYKVVSQSGYHKGDTTEYITWTLEKIN